MFAKIEISGTIEIVTGLHIGGSSAFSAIGDHGYTLKTANDSWKQLKGKNESIACKTV